ncbi:MAG TPA: hypothetical protein VK524_22900, partial [Polyangiaceae bacterium]|nr:hypothetical protein [Polyangiaceae bacterium]
MAGARPRLPARIARMALKSVIALLLVVFTLIVALLVLVNVPPSERFILDKVNDALASSFKGRVQIERIGTLDLFGMTHAHARVYAPNGRQVLDLRDVNVRLNLPRLAWGAVFGKGPLVLDFERLSLGHADVLLEQDASGALTLQTAFEPKQPAPTEAPPGRPVEVQLADIQIDHAWLHGGVPALPTIDAELHGLRGFLSLDEAGTQLGVERVSLLGRALPNGANPAGILTAELQIPSDSARGMNVNALFSGRVRQIETRARVALHNQFLTAQASLP